MTLKSLLWRKQYVMTSKIRHEVSYDVKTRHDAKKFVVTSKTRHDIKKSVMTSKIRHDVKRQNTS